MKPPVVATVIVDTFAAPARGVFENRTPGAGPSDRRLYLVVLTGGPRFLFTFETFLETFWSIYDAKKSRPE